MHNNALHALDSTLAAAEPHDQLTWSEFLAQLPRTTSVTVGGRKYGLDKVGSNLHVVCDNDEVLTFAVINGNLDMLIHGNFVSSLNVHEVLRKHKTKEELLRYLIGRAHGHCATAAAEPGVIYDIDEVIDTLQNLPKERFIGHGVTIFLDEKGSVAFVTSKHGAGLGYVERGVGGKIKLRLNNASETVAGRVTSMEHLAVCILTFAERVSGKAHASAEPQAIPTGPRTPNQAHADLLEFLNARNKFTIPNVRGYRVTVGRYNTVCPVIHVWKPEWARFGYEITCIVDQHRSARGTYPKLYKVIDPRSTVVSGNFELVSGDIHTGVTSWKDLLRKAIALMIRRGESDVKKLAAEQKQAKATAEPGRSGFEDAAEAVETACRRYESSNSLGLDIEEIEIDAEGGSANITLSTAFSMLDGEDGVIRAEFTYESGALTIYVADNVVINNKKLPFPNADVWARMVSTVLAFLERVLVTERKRINTELKRVETDFTSGMSKLFKVRVGKPPIKLHVSWRTGSDAAMDQDGD